MKKQNIVIVCAAIALISFGVLYTVKELQKTDELQGMIGDIQDTIDDLEDLQRRIMDHMAPEDY